MSGHDSLQQQLQAGGQVTGKPSDATRAAEALGYAVFDADCDRAKTRSAVLRAIANAVDFPEYFGSNLDALLDCLTSTVLDQPKGVLLVLRNLHTEDPGIAEHVEAILETCSDASEYVRDNGRVFAYLQA